MSDNRKLKVGCLYRLKRSRNVYMQIVNLSIYKQTRWPDATVCSFYYLENPDKIYQYSEEVIMKDWVEHEPHNR